MLIRFVASNIYSFDENKEFNLLPRPKIRALPAHKYSHKGLDFLKMSAIYGANGAGKSNLVNALELLQDMVVKDAPAFRAWEVHFKFAAPGNEKQVLGVEFLQEETAFYYALEITKGLISAEELYTSGLGKAADKLIFERKTLPDGSASLTFLEALEKDAKGQLLKSILQEEFIKPGKTILKLLANRDNIHLQVVKKAFRWFADTLQIISPDSRPAGLAHELEDPGFKGYAESIMRSFNIGISGLITERRNLDDIFKNDRESQDAMAEIQNKLTEGKQGMVGLRNVQGKKELLFVKEGDKIVVKELKLEHTGADEQKAFFTLDEESDGTIRLLDFVPAFRDVVSNKKVYVIDEIERSMHPNLVKELVGKFSHDDQTKGQLIITTHESNLLDQSIFRQDEIWFVEKKKSGATELYSLSDFKEHNTIDIRKGYLNGRYGSIPFLANLQDLNWHANDSH